MLMLLHTELYAQNNSAINETAKTASKSLSITITPRTMWARPFNNDCGTDGKCRRMAERALKEDKYTNAVAYAASGLGEKCSKRIKRKLLAILTPENYAKSVLEFDAKKKDLSKKIAKYTGVQSATDVHHLRWYSLRLAITNKLIEAIDNPTKIKLHEVSPDDLETLSRKLRAYSDLAAEEYIVAGNEAFGIAKSKEDFKRAFMYFDIALQYNPQHTKAVDLAEQARKKATSTVYISSHYESHGGFARVLDEDVKAALQKVRGFTGLRFVEITDSKNADYHIKLVANGLELVTRGKTSDKNDFTKDVEVDGKVTTKKATITTYTSGYDARAKININVVERKTRKVVYSSAVARTYIWKTVWQTSSNSDTGFIKAKYKRHLGKSPDRAPEKRTLYERAISLCASQTAHSLYSNFFYKVGSAPTH